MRRARWLMLALVSVTYLVATTEAWAECQFVIQPDFVGTICVAPDTVSRCAVLPTSATTTTVECRVGRWLFDEGGVFDGVSKSYKDETATPYSACCQAWTRTSAKTGDLRSPTFDGTFESTATEYRPVSANLNYLPRFSTDEARHGIETLSGGGIFAGAQTTSTYSSDGHSGPGFTLTQMNKNGTLTTDQFSGTLKVESSISRSDDRVQPPNGISITTMAGTWTLSPTARQTGTLITAVVNGVTTVTDNRGTVAVRPPETPWQTNAYGSLRTGINYNYNMGYQFIPQVNGRVTQLGGFFNGTKTVRLYNASGSFLAWVDVTANNGWAYAPISPVQLQAGQTYTVAVNLAGSGASYRGLGTTLLPQTFGSVRILSSVYLSNSTLMPTTQTLSYMFGQADIEFVPDN